MQSRFDKEEQKQEVPLRTVTGWPLDLARPWLGTGLWESSATHYTGWSHQSL